MVCGWDEVDSGLAVARSNGVVMTIPRDIPEALAPHVRLIQGSDLRHDLEVINGPLRALEERTRILSAMNVALSRRLEALEAGDIDGVIHRCGWCGGGLVRLPSQCRFCGEHNHRSGE